MNLGDPAKADTATKIKEKNVIVIPMIFLLLPVVRVQVCPVVLCHIRKVCC